MDENSTIVTVICPEHGEWTTSAIEAGMAQPVASEPPSVGQYHISIEACPKCWTKRKT